jgi:hypothetical protein
MNRPDTPQSSKQIWLWALLAILVVTTVGSGIMTFFLMKMPSAAGVNGVRLDSTGITPIDLAAHYDNSTLWNRPGEWEAVPHGHQMFGGVPFEADGLIVLIGEGARKDKRRYRERVEGIAVGKKFERLHLLHTAHYPAEDETPYARVVLHYTDGSTTSFQLVFGRHARDWWRRKNESVSALSDPNSKVVWRGNDAGRTPGNTRRLFKTTFENRKPNVEVATIDLVSENATPNATIIAMSVGPANLPEPKDDPPSLPEPDEPPGGAIKFTAVDAESGQPVAKVKLRISGDEMGGSFRASDVVTDAEGKCLVRYPASNTVVLNLNVSGVEVTPTRIRWQTARGEKIPSEYLFRVTRPIAIGGTVLNDAGQPLTDARISFRDYALPNTPANPRERFLVHGSSVMTRADGSWEFRSLPPKFRDFSINVSHPDFVHASFITSGVGRGFSNMPMDKLTDRTAVIQLRRRGPTLDDAGKPIMENILPNIAAGSGGIQNALPWWKELSSGRRDGIHDPAAPPGRPGCFGSALGAKGHENEVVIFQTRQTLSYHPGGWYVQLTAPPEGQFSSEEIGRIMADWLEKTYGFQNGRRVRVLE